MVSVEQPAQVYELKTVYEPSPEEERIYDKYANLSDDNAELWESGQLGASEEHVRRVSAEKAKEIHDALGLQPVTVGLQKERQRR